MNKVSKNEKKTLIFIGYMADPLLALGYLKNKSENFIVVSTNCFTSELEKMAGIKIKYSEDFLQKDDYEYMENYAAEISKTWHTYLPPRSGITSFKNIEIAKIMQMEIYMFLCTTVKNLHLILKIIAEVNPEEIVLLEKNKEDGLGGIAKFLRSVLSIKTHFVCIGGHNPVTTLRQSLRNAKQGFVNVAIEFLDMLERIYLKSGAKYRNAVLMDYRFSNIVKNISNEFFTIPYIVAKGLHIRLDFLRRKQPYFSFRKITGTLNNKKEKIYFRKIDEILKTKFNKETYLRYKDHCIHDVLRPIFKDCIEKRIPVLKTEVCRVCSFLEVVKPKILILRDSIRVWEYSLAAAAENLRIPNLVIQHGLETLKDVYSQQTADSMAFWGGAWMEWYKSAGSDVSKSKVTGSPLHDEIYDKRHGRIERYKSILEGLGANPEKPTIIYLGNCIKYHPLYSVHFIPDLSLFSLKLTLNAFKEFEDVQLIIKLHPYYNRNLYPSYSKEISGFPNVFVLKNADIPDLFSGSTAVISELFSTAIMDAIILKKPVIFYNFAKKDRMIPLRKRGVGIEVKNLGELKSAIRDILSPRGEKKVSFLSKDSESFIKDYAYSVDGQSSKRVKDFIRELA